MAPQRSVENIPLQTGKNILDNNISKESFSHRVLTWVPWEGWMWKRTSRSQSCNLQQSRQSTPAMLLAKHFYKNRTKTQPHIDIPLLHAEGNWTKPQKWHTLFCPKPYQKAASSLHLITRLKYELHLADFKTKCEVNRYSQITSASYRSEELTYYTSRKAANCLKHIDCCSGTAWVFSICSENHLFCMVDFMAFQVHF